jgi:recombination protein RecR
VKIPSKYIENAVEQLSSLPGIGKRTALRLVLQLLNRTESEIEQFSLAFTEMKSHVKKCTSCGNISDTHICTICADPKRDHSIICVVEDIRDVLAIEGTESYRGIYHVLGGIISPMDGVGPSDLNIPSLVEKANTGKLIEIIFALSPTMEGDTTNFYLYKKLGDKELIISTLSRGVTVGTELQYADDITLSRSLLQRQPFKV